VDRVWLATNISWHCGQSVQRSTIFPNINLLSQRRAHAPSAVDTCAQSPLCVEGRPAKRLASAGGNGRCPTECPTGQQEHTYDLTGDEGRVLNRQDIMNILNTEIPTVNEDGVGSSPTAPAKLLF
jgi:hypothetical protein